ncbi:MAG TPA: hypothetical protein VK850_17540 [Candidatus Binatia bacterium]|nr:hypothetical protein [Candidatus Binatia bacterium]
MRSRPLSVTIVGCLFIGTGAVGLAYHAKELGAADAFKNDGAWVCLVRLLAIVFGVFTLRGSNWARWGLILWMAYHVVLSVYHSLSQVLMHALLTALFAWLLLRPAASAYFRSARSTAA